MKDKELNFTDDEMIILCRGMDIAEGHVQEYMCPNTHDYDKKYCKLFTDLEIKIKNFLKSQSVINEKRTVYKQLDDLIKEQLDKAKTNER